VRGLRGAVDNRRQGAGARVNLRAVDDETRHGDAVDTDAGDDGVLHGDSGDGATLRGDSLDDRVLDDEAVDDEAVDDEAPAIALSGFEVHHLLGAGATGQVWLAREAASGDLVAIKRLHDPGDAAGRERLLREAVLLAGFTHDHLIRLRSVQADGDGAPVLVLDHASGGSLAALLARRGRLEPGEVVTVAAPLAQALAAAHAAGLVHADVTPANVLFDATGRPLLADLGVSRLVGERRAVVESTADYLDPAVAAGGEPTPATDVHALAAVCHHLLTGSPPYTGSSLVQVLRAAAAGQRTPLRALAPTVPSALLEVVEAGLASDPAARPTAEAFAASLLAAVPALPVRLRSSGPPPGPPGGPPGGDSVPEVAHGSRWRRRGRPPRVTPPHTPVLDRTSVEDPASAEDGTTSADPSAVSSAAAAAVWQGNQARVGGAPATVVHGLGTGQLPGAQGLGLSWSSGIAGPRPTHAVPVRLVEPASPADPLAEVSGWRERWRDAVRGRRALVATSAVVLVLLVGGVVGIGGAAAVGDHVDGPLAVAAPAEQAVGPGTATTGATDGSDASGGTGASGGVGATGATASTDSTGSSGSTGSTGATGATGATGVPEQAQSRQGAPSLDRGGQSPGQPNGGTGAETASQAEDWRAVVDGLDAVRASAFFTADPRALDGVYAPGSEALAADREALAGLAAGGLTIDGARHEIRDVTVLDEEPGRVRVRVLDRLPEHRVLDRDEGLVEVRPGTTLAPVDLELVDSADGWRIASVTRG
jgi:serine/threonine protein kinase